MNDRVPPEKSSRTRAYARIIADREDSLMLHNLQNGRNLIDDSFIPDGAAHGPVVWWH